MDDNYELTLQQLGDAETAVDKLAEFLRELYHDPTLGAEADPGDIEDLFEELDLDL